MNDWFVYKHPAEKNAQLNYRIPRYLFAFYQIKIVPTVSYLIIQKFWLGKSHLRGILLFLPFSDM